jgi:hypothetical protein
MGKDDEYSTGLAFGLWLACLLGACGIHRFYLGKSWTGLLYLFTFGLFGVGQIVDLVRMRELVEDANVRHEVLETRAARKLLRRGRALPELPPAEVAGQLDGGEPREDLSVALTRAASKNKGAISVTQGVLATGRSFEEVEAALDEMARSGYVGIDNDPESGVVVYTFRELA